MNTHLQSPVSVKTVQRKLHAAKIRVRVAMPKPLISAEYYEEITVVPRPPKLDTSAMGTSNLIWCTLIYIISDHWTCLRQRTPAEAFQVDCLIPTVKHRGSSVIMWGAVSSRGLEPPVVLRKMITSDHYWSIFADHIHPMLQTLFLGECPMFQDDNIPVHTFRCAQTCLHEHE